MEINVNDYVWVRLTAHGEDILRRQHQELLDSLPEAARRVVGPYTPLERDADGWSKVQIWKLMGCFGAHMYNGCEMPFKTTIRVNKVEPDTPENLNEVPPERPGGDQQSEEMTTRELIDALSVAAPVLDAHAPPPLSLPLGGPRRGMKTWFKAYRADGSLASQTWTSTPGTEAAERSVLQARLDRFDLACVEVFHEDPHRHSEKLTPPRERCRPSHYFH